MDRYIDPSLGVAGPTDEEILDYCRLLGRAWRWGPEGIPGSILQRCSLTEQCLQPGRNYLVIGNCTLNPVPASPYEDRGVIKEQDASGTFVISNKTKEEFAKGVAREAFVWLAIGAALVIGSTAAILHVLGADACLRLDMLFPNTV